MRKKQFAGIAFIAAFICEILIAVNAGAATKIWVGTAEANDGNFAIAANWSPSGVPTTGDDVYFEDSSQDCNLALDQSAITLNSMNIAQSYTGEIGTTTEYLQVEANTVNIGYTYGPETSLYGSPRIKLDLGTNTSAINVYNSAALGTELTMPPIRIICSDASTTLSLKKGKVGIAFETGETATLAAITSTWTTSQSEDVDLYVGTGVTMTTLTQTGGDTMLGCAATTVNLSGGTLTTYGSGTITTVNAGGGTFTGNSTGTITTLNITGGTANFLKSAAARTVTTAKLDSGGAFKFDPAVLTITNKIISNSAVTYTASAP